MLELALVETEDHSVEARDEVAHLLPLSDPTHTRIDRANQVAPVLSGVRKSFRLGTVRTLLKLGPLFTIQHELAVNTSGEFLARARLVTFRDDHFSLMSNCPFSFLLSESLGFVTLLIKVTVTIFSLEFFLSTEIRRVRIHDCILNFGLSRVGVASFKTSWHSKLNLILINL